MIILLLVLFLGGMGEDKSGQREAVRQRLPASLVPPSPLAPAAELAPGARPTASADVTDDDMLLALWLHGRPAHTVRAYRYEWERFRAHAGDRELRTVRLRHVQDYLNHLVSLAPNTQRRAQAVLKSLFTFAVRVGYLPVNMGAFLRPIAAKDSLSERILDEATVHRVIAHERDPRNRAMLTLLYAGGLRVSELCRLTWRDLAPRDDAGQVAVYGKGGKTRVVLLSPATWRELAGLRGSGVYEIAQTASAQSGDGIGIEKVQTLSAQSSDPVFPSQKGGGHLDPSQVLRIVKRAAARAGVDVPVSPHWFRHAHASHALERGCPISLVQATLGHATVSTTGRYLHARPGDSSARYLGV